MDTNYAIKCGKRAKYEKEIQVGRGKQGNRDTEIDVEREMSRAER